MFLQGNRDSRNGQIIKMNTILPPLANKITQSRKFSNLIINQIPKGASQ